MKTFPIKGLFRFAGCGAEGVGVQVAMRRASRGKSRCPECDVALKQKVAAEIRRIFNAEDRAHAEAKLAEFVKTYGKSAPKLATWAEENIPEGLTVFSLPEAGRQRLRSSNRCATLNSQIKRRARVVGFFPNESSLLGLVAGVIIEISEEGETGKIHLQPQTKKQ